MPIGPITPPHHPERSEGTPTAADTATVPAVKNEVRRKNKLSRCCRKGKNKLSTAEGWLRRRNRVDVLNLIGVKNGNPCAEFMNGLVREVIRKRYLAWKKCSPPAGLKLFTVNIPYPGLDLVPEIPRINRKDDYDPYCDRSCCQLLRDAGAVPFGAIPIRQPQPTHVHYGGIDNASFVPESERPRPDEAQIELQKRIQAHSRKIHQLDREIQAKKHQLGLPTPSTPSSRRSGTPRLIDQHRSLAKQILKTPPSLSKRDLDRLSEAASTPATYPAHKQVQLADRINEPKKVRSVITKAARKEVSSTPVHRRTNPAPVFTPTQRTAISLSEYKRRPSISVTVVTTKPGVLKDVPLDLGIEEPVSPVSTPPIKLKRSVAAKTVLDGALGPESAASAPSSATV